MIRYYSTFITGFEDIIEAALRRHLKNVVIENVFDGGIVYSSHSLPDQVAGLRFFNNSFILYQSSRIHSDDPIREIMLAILRKPNLGNYVAKSFPFQRATFRIVASKENQLVAMDHTLMRDIEACLAKSTRLSINRSRPDYEFWLMSRSEGYGLFCLRITRHRDYAKVLERGELRPELAHILCLISEPSSSDVFLDPFCGSGAIPIERARSFPYKSIIAGDIDGEVVEKLKRRIRRDRVSIDASVIDARSLSFLEPETVDRIVTDPPWGLFKAEGSEVMLLYRDTLNAFCRVVKMGGIIVIIVSNKQLFDEVAVEHNDCLSIIRRFDTLVSGKKARVYKLMRI
jgi:tRNA (guanine6-N2)-methyltransferase